MIRAAPSGKGHSVIELPPIARTKKEKLDCLHRMQQKLMAQRSSLVGDAAALAGWDRRLMRLARELNKYRRVVYPLPPGWREWDEDPAFEAKLAARADDGWDRHIKGNPLLVIERAEPRPDPPQDFETFTDPGGDFTVGQYQIFADDIPQNDDRYIYKDFGAGYFSGDYNWRCKVKVSAGGADWSCGMGPSAAQEVDDLYNNTDAAGIEWFWRSTGPKVRWYVYHFENAAIQDSDNTADRSDVGKYMWFDYSRSGSTVTCGVYSDEFNTLVDTLTMDDDGTARRYCFAASSRNDGTAGRSIDFYVNNLDLMPASHPWYLDMAKRRNRA